MSAVDSLKKNSVYDAVFGMKYPLQYVCTDLDICKCLSVFDRLLLSYHKHIKKIAIECGDISPLPSGEEDDIHQKVEHVLLRADKDKEPLGQDNVLSIWDKNSDIEGDEGYIPSVNETEEEEECEVLR